MSHNIYHNSDNSFLTFIVGAIAGAAAVMFLDKDMRTKVEETRDKLEDKAQEKLSETQDKLEEQKVRRENNPNNNS